MDGNTKNEICILDEATINKIAAGEVIERPASVIKELIDNAIDAGATDVRVEIGGCLSTLISIVDNGYGMSKSDVSIAFLKHATSKIRSADDLFAISTMGFRGEALSSIAAISKLSITTRQNDDISGTKLVVEGGDLKDVSDIGAAVGTRVTVEDLFYNTPARKKYLKSDRTELAHVTDVVTRYALGNTDVSFTLISDGRTILRAPVSDGLFDRIIHVLGSDVAKAMIPVSFESELAKVSGFVSQPELTRSGNDLQSFFVNGRSVNSKAISNALRLGFYTLIPKGRYPAAVLNISIDPKDVDVNVHPAKTEVRFGSKKEVMDAITKAVEEAHRSQVAPEIDNKESTVQLLFDNIEPETISKPSVEITLRESTPSYNTSTKDTERRLKRTERELLATKINTTENASSVSVLDDMKILGQIDNLYIITKSKDGLLIIDQHAAHERILFDQIKDHKTSGWQELITPLTIELNAKERILLEEYIPYLEEFGFAISEFGTNTYVITSIPNIFGKLEDPDIVHDIISDILSTGRIRDETGIYEHVSKSMACRGAIKAGAACNLEQMENLVAQLMRTENPRTCPHGRPTFVLFSKKELDKLFGRI
ncbi:MAG: DNA mismatch repair endonuclease MutL [Methanosarcinaceae archaeon]|nr:DNA mismatch repair endonuclease MutL [Methanosarcinaceae archaeon]